MDAELLVSRILDDEGLTDGLNDPEARLLVEWLVEQAEQIAREADSESAAWQRLETLCKRARSIRRFISLWCHTGDPGAAAQLAAAEKFHWPFPSPDCTDPCDVLQQILTFEKTHMVSR